MQENIDKGLQLTTNKSSVQVKFVDQVHMLNFWEMIEEEQKRLVSCQDLFHAKQQRVVDS